jgi:hypothetical protein
MPKYTFTVSGSQLIVSLVPVESDVQPTSMSYLAPSFKIGVGKINAYEYGQPKQSFLFTEIGEIDGVEPTDLQDAFDKLTTAIANFNGGGAAPYKVYTALLSQSGTDAPVATVLENTLGGDIVWSRSQAGVYLGTLDGAFPIEKTFVIITNTGGQEANCYVNDNNVNYVGIATSEGADFTDNLLFKTPIEIRVYN